MLRPGVSQNDTSWSGWAISSFTNKLAAASGEMQSKPSSPQSRVLSSDGRPVATDTAAPPQSGASASKLHRQALVGTSSIVPVLTRTSTDQFFGDAQYEDDEIDDAWGEMGDEPFFDMPPEEPNATPQSTITAFDDGGEPDFEGWLKAQAQAKSKAPLPKGLAKSSTQNMASSQSTPNRPAKATARSITTGTLGSGAGVKKLASPTVKPTLIAKKAISTKPEKCTTDDDWGDAWD